MLGERKSGWVTQSGWVQAVYNSFLSPGAGRSRKGLFSANLSTTQGPLRWSRPQQAAFLILLWQILRDAVSEIKHGWAEPLRTVEGGQLDLGDNHDLAFSGPKTLLNQEQGVRGFCLVLNDVLFRACADLKLDEWISDSVDVGETRSEDVNACIAELKRCSFIDEISRAVSKIAEFDWRSSDAPGLSDQEALIKAAFRGTGGYSRIRTELLGFLAGDAGALGVTASQIISAERV